MAVADQEPIEVAQMDLHLDDQQEMDDRLEEQQVARDEMRLDIRKQWAKLVFYRVTLAALMLFGAIVHVCIIFNCGKLSNLLIAVAVTSVLCYLVATVALYIKIDLTACRLVWLNGNFIGDFIVWLILLSIAIFISKRDSAAHQLVVSIFWCLVFLFTFASLCQMVFGGGALEFLIIGIDQIVGMAVISLSVVVMAIYLLVLNILIYTVK